MLSFDPRLKTYGRALRGNLTEAEQKLWYRLRRKQINGWQFYRQKPLGPYIVDFYCPAAALVVELDGGQHFEPENLEADRKRDAYLAGLGLRVLRFDNRQALRETDAVMDVITRVQIPPSPPFSKGGATPRLVEPVEDGSPPPAPVKQSAPPAAPPPIPPFEKGGPGGIYTASTEDKA
ncbi:MAG: endonuclease domain-containing protein [Gallionellaceae bacterium]|nr:endonuclease domain-containing protein [Gallionellaceae bacterium]